MACFFAVFFISGEAVKAKEGDGDVVGSFVGHEVAVVGATKFVDEGNPELGIVFEFF